jgi:hypothetical protein
VNPIPGKIRELNFKPRHHPVIRSVSSFATSDGASAIVSEVIVLLVLSYLIPAIHHIRRDDATARKRRDYALAFHLGITDFATGRPQSEAGMMIRSCEPQRWRVVWQAGVDERSPPG